MLFDKGAEDETNEEEDWEVEEEDDGADDVEEICEDAVVKVVNEDEDNELVEECELVDEEDEVSMPDDEVDNEELNAVVVLLP